MTSATTPVPTPRGPELAGQTVVVIGGSAGIGLETARLARAEGADVILTGRDPGRLERAAAELGGPRTAAFDATDWAALDRFFAGLPGPVDHVMVTGPGPYYAPLAELTRDRGRLDWDHHIWLPVAVAQQAVGRVRPGGRADGEPVGVSWDRAGSLPASAAGGPVTGRRHHPSEEP